MWMKQRLALVLVILALAGCAARNPGEPIQPGFNLFSRQQDVQLGQEAAAQVSREVEIVDNRTLQDYVSTLGRVLASQPESGDWPYRFTLINDKSINAFALPGGPVYLHSGLFNPADNEAQLVGVVAHEISHVALRHGTNQASKAQIAQLPAVLAGAALGQGSLIAQLGQIGIGIGFNSVLLKYSRDAENQADALGTRIMARAGYNPLEMAHFFEKLEAQGGSGAPQFLSSHPNPGNRLQAVEAEIRTLPQRSYNANTGRFSQMKSLAAGLPPPRKGR